MSLVAPTSSAPLTLEQVKEQFSTWRKTRTKLGRIPSSLWESINHLIKDQGYIPRQVAAELGLNYQQMQSKIAYAPEQKCLSPHTPDFIKVSLPPISSSSSPPLHLWNKKYFSPSSRDA